MMTKLELWCRCALLLSVMTKGSARSAGSEIYPWGDAASRVLLDASNWTVERTGEAEVSFSELNSEIVNVTMSFNFSDKFAGVIIYGADCETNLPNGTLEAELLSVDWDGAEDPFKTANIALGLNTTSIMANTSLVTVLGDDISAFGFCARGEVYELLDPEDINETIVVNFHETVLNLTMDLSTEADFSLSVDVDRLAAEEENAEISYDEFINAYPCDDNKDPTESTGPLTQGEVLQLCVTSTNKVVTVDKILDLTLEQGTDNTFTAIEGSKVKYPTLVTSDGDNCSNDICMVKVVLIAKFFSEDDPYNVEVSGSVKLEVGADTGGAGERRYLETASIKRNLEASAGGFNLVFEVESAAAQADSSVGRKSMASAHILAVALYLMMS